jgi:hypothetical protein
VLGWASVHALLLLDSMLLPFVLPPPYCHEFWWLPWRSIEHLHVSCAIHVPCVVCAVMVQVTVSCRSTTTTTIMPRPSLLCRLCPTPGGMYWLNGASR